MTGRPSSSRRANRRSPKALRGSRDQNESAFASILASLVGEVAGARAAALVDPEGETVDYAGGRSPFDLRVAAAHWRIVLDQARAHTASQVTWIAVRAERRSFLVRALPEGYALVLVLARTAALAGAQTAVLACARALGQEAGWPSGHASPPAAPRCPIEIKCDARGRPSGACFAGKPWAFEIVGGLVSPSGGEPKAPDEQGWRIRFEMGLEATLMRNGAGEWYVDEALDDALPDARRRKSLTGRSR